MVNKIKSIDLLPDFLKTDKNNKFLSSTIDQLIQKPSLERLDGFVGSKLTPNYNSNNDNYIPDVSNIRKNYQLSPALIINDQESNITDVISFDDLINEIKLQGGYTNNLDRLFDTTYYSYNPFIDWDKFINYQEYYWLVTGPQTIVITGKPQNTTSTFNVTESANGDSFVFSPDGLSEDPLLTLYRGNTYIFDVNSNQKFFIKTQPTFGNNDILNNNITNNGISNGKIILIVDETTPDSLYYVGSDSPNAQGQFVIKSIQEDTKLDVENEIIGKQNYTSGTGVKFSNGMKIQFGGNVTPSAYKNKEYFVEGVGKEIKLIEYSILTSSADMADTYNDNFDTAPFDTFPFDTFKKLPIDPEYITINRSSRDLNPWSRYNRWVHKDIIKISAELNNQIPVYPSDKRAKRPIIEFIPDLQLYNFGSQGIKNVDLIDTTTLDVFNTIENSQGYYVDQNLLEQGYRVIFNADLDPDVRGKIYIVNYVLINGKKKLELIPADDHIPNNDAAVSVNYGSEYKGTNWWYNGSEWVYSQQHTKLNEPPLFDLFDSAGKSYSKDIKTDFAGNKIFGYTPGTINDPVLGFQIKQENSVGIGSYSFKNFLMTETFGLIENNLTTTTINTYNTFIRINDSNITYRNSWIDGKNYQIPIIQFDTITTSTSNVKVSAVDLSNSTYVNFDVFLNLKKINNSDYTTTVTNNVYSINFNNNLTTGTTVLLKIKSDGVLIEDKGYYEIPISITNNPDNSIVDELTLSEISNHVRVISESSSEFTGTYPGDSNLRDLGDVNGYANQIITNVDPGLFSSFFIGKKEHSLLDAISTAADDYNKFKLFLIKKISEINVGIDPVVILDSALQDINATKVQNSPYYFSDMLGYGSDKNIKTWNVTSLENSIFPLPSSFNLSKLNLKSVLIYVNDNQLVANRDYKFIDDTDVEILINLSLNDKVTIVDYFSTEGNFVPATPTKLGLYPKFEPKIFVDDTYVSGPTNVIQGHDGSITVAFNDYRDNVLLEFEKRVYNNIKVSYRRELLDFNSVIPGAFRNVGYSQSEINSLLQKDFIKWTTVYGVEYEKNTTFDLNNPYTWNYKDSFNFTLGKPVSGYWRAVYKYFYDTDRPHTHPWEMLGFSEKPSWWDSEYGPAPYTSGNDILWNDIELGNIKQGSRKGINKIYARPLLSNLLPVDEYGNLIDPTVKIVSDVTPFNQRQNFVFGDQGPAETSWRKSSYWPYVVQKLLALTKPALYSALMYDVSRLEKNLAGQWIYNGNFINLKNVIIPVDKNNITAGYSVYIIEAGKQRSINYIDKITSDIQNYEIKLFHKVGGFVNKNKLQIIIDAFDPTSTAPGAILPQEDYKLILNTGNPTKSLGISGIIIQKLNGKFVLKGYDTFEPYFTVYTPIRNSNTPSITVGGTSAPYLEWTGSSAEGNTGLTDIELSTASSASSSKYYQQGQIVSYQNKFYVVKISHYAKSTFNTAYFQSIPSLPIKGGATVQSELSFDKVDKKIPYGSQFDTLQDVYDVIIGYGAWLEAQGFIFDQYNTDLNESLTWKFSGKEFLYWTTQNWANNSIIALSPFADQLKFQSTDSVVDNVFSFENKYKILQVNGTAIPQQAISVFRDEQLCVINTTNTAQGMYYARLNLVQKEHAIVFNNRTIFNDTIYDFETGYRQLRAKLVGFRTKDWNGDYFSPGFVYDSVKITNWKKYTKYKNSDVVKYAGKYYSAIKNIDPAETFDFSNWVLLSQKPTEDLLPNFDYKIRQFEDFYSLDIDNFDFAQQTMAQHLTGYTPRVYLNNIFTNPISQYKFYQGFIKEKGTKNAINKLAKASIQNRQGEVEYNEVWAFRLGHFGSFETFKEIEFPLIEGTFIDNPQIINFVDNKPTLPNDLIYYQLKNNFLIKPKDYVSSNTFVTTLSTFDDNVFQLKTAGYVRLEDITATALNEDSLFDIASNSLISEGDTIWLGFRNDGEWDVLRYTRNQARIISAQSDQLVTQVTLTTDIFHDIKVNDIISISQLNDSLNGVYKVIDIPSLTSFVIEYTGNPISIAEGSIISLGLLFKFVSYRFSSIDNFYSDNNLINLNYGTKFWVDADVIGKWKVYEKTKNYKLKTKLKSSLTADTNQFGYAIAQRTNSNVVLVGAPNFYDSTNYGKVYVYKSQNDSLVSICQFTLNENKNYHVPGTKNEFGSVLFYDSDNYLDTGYGLVFVGAPSTSNVKSNSSTGIVRESTGTGAISAFVQEGAVKISSIDPILIREKSEFVLLSPYPSNYQRFGSSIYVQRNTTTKLALVGAPGTLTTGSGAVYAYNILSTSTPSLQIIAAPSGIQVAHSGTISVGSQWGFSISGSDDSSVIAMSAPGYNNQKGMVQIFNGTSYVQTLEIPSGIAEKSRFGNKVLVSPDGLDIFVTAPNSKNADNSLGKVVCYRKNSITGLFTVTQIILNPISDSEMNFGANLDLNSDKDLLVISALGNNSRIFTTFDNYTNPSEIPLVNDPESDLKENLTNFDNKSTTFKEGIKKTGAVYLYDKKNSKYILADEIYLNAYKEGNNYGHGVSINDSSIYVGAPSYSTTTNVSYLYNFAKIDKTVSGYKVLHGQDDLVDVNLLNRNVLINTEKEEVVEYLDVIDPLKGKIAGIAQQELTYRSENDPAIYSVGIVATNNDENTNWLDEHVGELWWDLSTLKYMWYEQGDLNFRKNTWGKVFPGATIDVYEWVRSEYLPNEWATLADTAEGLVNSISGQPKYPDNTVLSVKQVLDPASGTFINVYYYWVKNKVTLPSKKNRRISCYQVANIIADPITYGLKTIQILSADSISLSNISTQLISDKISLNVSFDTINNRLPRHTEWMLLKENSENSVPNTLLEKKLIDSFVGYDNLGNPVPDKSLTFRERYGIGIRPQQTMFKDRYEALRNAVEFINSVLIKNPITDTSSFNNLNSEDPIPDASLNQYDVIVEDLDYLSLEVPNTSVLKTGELKAYVKNGKIYNVTIENQGFGYRYPPTVTISDNENNNAIVKTAINSNGQIVSVEIVNPGNSFTTAPTLTVRPFIAIVLIDENLNNRWAKYYFNEQLKLWVKIATQKFNTKLYWRYVDYVSDDYKPYNDYSYTLDNVFQLQTLSNVSPGEYIKIKNGGDGRYIIIEKTPLNVLGNFSNNYNLVYSEKGTIQINDSIWNFISGDLTFDKNNRYDQTLYDQTPVVEIKNIFLALKEDIFIGNLKINWNLLFFKAVKYALSEQKLLDWAFKTSFIDVVNYAGTLNQRSVYKLDSSSYFEDYLKEVKPYHSIIRNYTTNYNNIEPTNTYITDFDFPTYYNEETGKFDFVEFDNELINEYPWKSWADNYKCFIADIIIADAGKGYTAAPTVTIQSAVGDTGTGATARAYISSGKLSSIEIINPGKNYTKLPNIILSGGGVSATQGRAYARLGNDKVRANTIGIKFDRISATANYVDNNVSDSFICDGYSKEFVLTWLATPDNLKISVTLDGNLVLGSDYIISYFTELYNGYNKKFSKIVFVNDPPIKDSVLRIDYVKNIELLHAAEKIVSYYTNTNDIGKDLSQLMEGVEFPYNTLEGLPFDYTSKWDVEYQPFGQFAYADNVDFSRNYIVGSVAATGTNTIALTTTTGIQVGQYANVISYIVNKFATSSTVVVSSVTNNSVTFSSTLSGAVYPGDKIEIWSQSTSPTLIDTDLFGGNWINSTSNYISNALGINPEDVIVSGDGFFTQDSLYATEELVPGFVTDTLGINVYTKNSYGAPLIYSSFKFNKVNSYEYITLPFLPPSQDYIKVTFDDISLTYNSQVENVGIDLRPFEFTINWTTKQLIISELPTAGLIKYTIIGISTSEASLGVGLVDFKSTVTNLSLVQVVSDSIIDTVNSAYVTVNGVSVPKITQPTSSGFTLTMATDGSRRAVVNVYVSTPLSVNTVQAYFFSGLYGQFNEIKEQVFDVSSTPTSIFTLSYPPGVSGPLSANIIVDKTDISGTVRLLPPFITYYDVTNSINTIFAINKYSSDPLRYNLNDFTILNVKVYINGKALRPGFDYSVPVGTGNVDINSDFIKVGNTVAIECLVQGLTSDLEFDYNVVGDKLILQNSVNNLIIKVITYNDNDGLLARTERFIGSPDRRYKISRPVLNDSYVWVQVNGVALISKLDYEVLDDQVTIQISDAYNHTIDDEVVITSFSSEQFAYTVLGYRIFKDIFNRTHFKRLSKNNTTYLIKELNFNDTEIYVADSTVLTSPIPSKNIPGVILIDGERIEFYKVNGNILTQLRRSTLGTAPSNICQIGTKVIDQGINQTIKYSINNYKQVHITTSSNVYTILTSTNTINGDGIILTSNPNMPAKDQISVYYGGKPLRKAGQYHQDISQSFDSSPFNIKGTTSTSELLPSSAVKYDAYLIENTNQVWVYTNSKKLGSINGFEYNGLNYLPPEFSVNTSTQQLTLNVAGGVDPGVKITIVKKDFLRSSSWNDEVTTSTTLSLFDSTTPQAKFLQEQPAELPDIYYYGGST